MVSRHRLVSLRHRREQFEHRITTELSNTDPDLEAMRFFEAQKLRIAQLIDDIGARPADVAPRAEIHWEEDEPHDRAAS